MRKSALSPFFSPITLELMKTFFLKSNDWHYLADIAKKLKRTPSSLQRDLKAFAEAELLETRKEANRVYYRANPHSPILTDLQSLLIKTVGVKDVISENLKSVLKDSRLAFIYGSLARAEEVATSDVDLMIVGDAKLADISGLLIKTEKQLGREVNPTIYSEDEFRKRLREENSFLKTVLADKRLFVKGDENELQTLVG
jgi:predicted nucleotidyltransferase